MAFRILWVFSLALLGTLLTAWLDHPHLAQAQEVRKFDIGPSQRIYICPGDTKEITITTKIWDDLEDPPGWVPHAGSPLNIRREGGNEDLSTVHAETRFFISDDNGQATIEILGRLSGRGRTDEP